ncbi:MAG TPA: family 78 glycoside hydrolase catalytic domain [Chthoniobacterales bacterium]
MMKGLKDVLSVAAAMLLASQALAIPATSLSVDGDFTNPLGFYDAMPTFSWKLPPKVKKQTAYQIQVQCERKVWDSGWVASDRSSLVPYGGAPFVSRDRVAWRVRYRDENGKDSGWGEPAFFELGLLSSSDWKAQWIRPTGGGDPDKESVACLQRTFPIAKRIARARIYVTARGLFELALNGQRVGEDHFANGWTSYHKRLDTLTYDVTSQLRQGGNRIDAIVGDGWYAGKITWEPKVKAFYGKDPELLLQLEITYADGSTDIIASDGKWQGTFGGPIVSSSIYNGEEYDARRQPSDWKSVAVDTDIGDERLAPKPFPPVRACQTLSPQTITEPQPGRYIFDLGQNMVGWARVNIPVDKDKTVTIRFAEMLNPDGTLYTKNYRSAKETDTYTAAKTGRIEWEPHFTFHGFRYVELSGLPAGIAPQKDWVTGVVLHSALQPIGRFTSSSAKLNQLQSNIVWGQRGNFVDIPTDCPQRDERLGWTGDAEVFCPTAMFNYDCTAFWKSWLASMRDDQESDGRIPHVIPNVLPRWPGDSPGWMDAATIIPWEVYVRTGDTRILADNFEMMQNLVGWYRRQAVGGLLPKVGGFGDWLQPYGKTLKGDTPLPLVGDAYYARSAQLLANAAHVLGKEDDARNYEAEAAKVREAFTRQYFDDDGRLKNAPETQTGYVLALAFNLIPSELKARAAAHLAQLVREAGTHLRTGFLGTPYLTRALEENGYAELAFDLLFQESYPSWFYPIDQGATTMWERWNSYSRENGFGDATMNSFNHYAYGAIGQWMYERIAGLAPDPEHPGYKHFFIRPLIAPQLDSASATLDTPYGSASSEWTRKGRGVEMSVVIPPNTSATVEFPDGRKPQTLEAGAYRFAIGIESGGSK